MRLMAENFYDMKSAQEFYNSVQSTDGWKHIEERRGYIVVWYHDNGDPRTGIQPYD